MQQTHMQIMKVKKMIIFKIKNKQILKKNSIYKVLMMTLKIPNLMNMKFLVKDPKEWLVEEVILIFNKYNLLLKFF